MLVEDCRRLERMEDPHLRQLMAATGRSAAAFVRESSAAILAETAAPEHLQLLLSIGLAVVHAENTTEE